MDAETHNAIVGRIAKYRDAEAGIRADRTLSAVGKIEKLKTAYDAAQADITATTAAGEAKMSGTRQALEQKLFGVKNPNDAAAIVSMRDAHDRVGRVQNSDELNAVMGRAQATGDTALHRAGLAEAIRRNAAATVLDNNNWAGVIHQHSAGDPAIANDVAHYVDITTERGVTTQSFNAGLARHLAAPTELGRGYLAPAQVEQQHGASAPTSMTAAAF